MIHGPRLNCGPKDAGQGEVLVHDERLEDPTYAFMLSRLDYPDAPVPMGVLRQVNVPTYESLVEDQGQKAKAKKPTIEALLAGPETWQVK
jgi:2-oxoglutarate/2-oxoacid ferredoxin oxidoreductase subunit beta